MAILKEVRGKGGTLEFEDGTTATCDFIIRQTSDAGLRSTCQLSVKEASRARQRSAPSAVRLTGTTAEGRQVVLEGEFHIVRIRSAAITFVCSGLFPLRLGPTPTSGGRLVCALTNFFFTGTEWIELRNGASYKGAISLTVGGRLFTLQQSARADEKRRNLQDTEGTAITARLITELTDARERFEVIELVRHLAFLLSLAAGTLVSCIRWQLRDSEGRLVAVEIGSPPMRPYRPRVLIDRRDGEALKQFLEVTYANFVAMDSVYQFGKAIHAKIDTASSGFLETRTLAASALIEYLAGIYARENDFLTLLDTTTFALDFRHSQTDCADY